MPEPQTAQLIARDNLELKRPKVASSILYVIPIADNVSVPDLPEECIEHTLRIELRVDITSELSQLGMPMPIGVLSVYGTATRSPQVFPCPAQLQGALSEDISEWHPVQVLNRDLRKPKVEQQLEHQDQEERRSSERNKGPRVCLHMILMPERSLIATI
jgi:hypothetical protein